MPGLRDTPSTGSVEGRSAEVGHFLRCRPAAEVVDHFDDGGLDIEGDGTVISRTGRPFRFPALTTELLARLRAAVTAARLRDELATERLLLDAEQLPWSARRAG